MELTELGDDSDQFAVGFDLSVIPEAVKFVARENELTEMRRLLHGHKSRSAVVLHGLGGIGKTQLAIEYTTRHKEKYTAIFWLNASDEDSLKLSFRDIAQCVLENQNDRPFTSTLASVDLDGNLNEVVTAVKTWLNLEKNTRWLMIYDNYDNPWTGNLDQSAVDIRRFLPRADHGSIIITTRSAQVSQGHRIHVQKLRNIHEGLEILSNTSKRENVENGRWFRHGGIVSSNANENRPRCYSAGSSIRRPASCSFYGWGISGARDHEFFGLSSALQCVVVEASDEEPTIKFL